MKTFCISRAGWGAIAVAACCFARAAELRPVAVVSPSPVVAGFGVELMLDGDASTWVRFEDSTPDDPRRTCEFVLDLGRVAKTRGLRLVSQPDRRFSTSPSEIEIYAVDASGAARPLARERNLHPAFCGEAQLFAWPETELRFCRVVVKDAGDVTSRAMYAGKLPKPDAEYKWTGWVTAAFAAWGIPSAHWRDCPRVVDVAEATLFGELPEDFPGWNRFPARAFPQSRMEKDWRLQDFGFDGFAKAAKTCGAEYYAKCRERRAKRLARVAKKTPRIVYVKHYTISGDAELAGNAMLTDSSVVSHPRNWRKGGQLCLLTVHADGTVSNEVLLDCPEGMIRDPDVSHDGKKILFSMRRSFSDDERTLSGPCRKRTRAEYEKLTGDDFHLYVMDAETRAVKQITFSEPARCADYEGVWTSGGQILFQSTRCEQVIPCHVSENSNLYLCEADGSNVRRIGFDSGSTLYPQELNDGGFVYTRYEYNDRCARLQQPLFRMSPGFGMQSEYYGNNSRYPTSLIHFRAIPGSPKLIGINSGHHVAQKGKLVLLDRRAGTQGDDGITFVAGSDFEEKPGTVKSHYVGHPVFEKAWAEHLPFVDDFTTQIGMQWQYPWAYDENEWLVGFQPEGTLLGAKHGDHPNFGVYWQNAAGERELLAYDPEIECSQPVPLKSRARAHRAAPEAERDGKSAWGTFYVQDVYHGPGLEGVARGTVKTLRVCAIENRASFHKRGSMRAWWEPGWGKHVAYPGEVSGDQLGVPGSSWDVKHVLGEVKVSDDGSCAFRAPAGTPVYFQLLDGEGRCVQTMRSWATLLPGERQGCTGCHESKLEAPPARAAKAEVQAIGPAAGLGRHPLLGRLEREGRFASPANFMGVQAPRSSDPDAPTEGFSYRRIVQPILDRRCVKCHGGEGEAATRPNLTGKEVSREAKRFPVNWGNDVHYEAGRRFTESYFALTKRGRQSGLVNWYSSAGVSQMLPPYAAGSSQSKLMGHFAPAHHGVSATDEERRVVACWIDLGVPFSGSYSEATEWDDDERWIFDYHQNKRAAFAEREMKGF